MTAIIQCVAVSAEVRVYVCNVNVIYNKESLNNAHLSTWIYLFLEMYLIIGLANLGQYMKFGLILGGMNRSGLCVRV